MPMKSLSVFVLLLGALVVLTAFNIDNAIVPQEEILSGGVPKDGIPAILKPAFIRSEQAQFLTPDDDVIGVQVRGEARAYPIKILNLHEVVNDTVQGVPLVVTF